MYDWLGNGMYFWEQNLERAWEWAKSGRTNPKVHIAEPTVIGAVIEDLHQERYRNGLPQYDSVRGVFFEGHPIYESSGFMEQSHIQICVRNPNCIKGFFCPERN